MTPGVVIGIDDDCSEVTLGDTTTRVVVVSTFP